VTNYAIRAARPDEAGEISALALRSKAHWGYDRSFLDACREELTIPAELVTLKRTYVAVSQAGVEEAVTDASSAAGPAGAPGRILGFGTIEGDPPAGELGMLFIDPGVIGKGVGGALFAHLTATAAELGFHRLTIASDPNAEPFYLARGAVRIGTVPSGSVEGRVLPLLALAL
jgi:GNAT superfamily N-acetyltransferase